MKKQSTKGEKIFANYISDKRLISKIKNSIAKKNLILKWAEKLKRYFFQRRHTNGQQMHEKVLNTTNRLENANQNNQNANHLTPVRMAVIRKTRTSAGYNRDQREPWYTVSKDVNYIATAENNMLVPQKGKNRTTIPSSNSISRYLPKGNKITLSKRYLHSHGHCISSVQFSRSVVSDSL